MRGYLKQWRVNWPLLVAFVIIVVVFVAFVVWKAHTGGNTIPGPGVVVILG